MKIKDVMTPKAKTCYGDSSLAEAAREMWDTDCGILPVVDSFTRRLVGVITDRDICMGAMIVGLPLERIPVRRCCSRDLHVATVDEGLDVAAARMKEFAVRRLPVVDETGHVVGVVSLDDLAAAACAEHDREGAETLLAALATASRKA